MYCCALLFERILIFVFPFSLPQPFTTPVMLCQFYDLLQVIDNYVDNSKLPADQSDIVLEKQIKVCVGVWPMEQRQALLLITYYTQIIIVFLFFFLIPGVWVQRHG